MTKKRVEIAKARKAVGAATKPPAPAADRMVAIRAAATKVARQKTAGGAYFLLVSPHEHGGRRFVRLKAPSVLAWFQQAWRPVTGERSWRSDLRGWAYGLDSLFDKIDDENLQCPATDEELVPLLERHIYSEGGIQAEPHFLCVETNDDEVSIEYYFFDDGFLSSSDALDRLPPSGRPQRDEDAEEDYGEGDEYAQFITKLGDK